MTPNADFVETTKIAGNGFQTPYVGRGVAFADFDNDGFMDLVVGNNGDAPLLLRNSGAPVNHFLNFKLVGTKSNRDAMGARIRVMAGGVSQIREVGPVLPASVGDLVRPADAIQPRAEVSERCVWDPDGEGGKYQDDLPCSAVPSSPW